jgi:hypothetical protein
VSRFTSDFRFDEHQFIARFEHRLLLQLRTTLQSKLVTSSYFDTPGLRNPSMPVSLQCMDLYFLYIHVTVHRDKFPYNKTK